MRVLLLSGPVGESHLAMAQSLAADVRRADPAAVVQIHNTFAVLGPLLGRVLERGYTFHLGEVKWSYDLAYRLFTGRRAVRAAGERALTALGGTALANLIRHAEPDVAVATHPVLNAVLARLRAAGRVQCPVAMVVGPLGGLGFWVQPGADLHLLNYPQALPEVEREAGTGSAIAVRPLVREEFFRTPSREQARRELGIPDDRRLVLISGGGWGAGDLEGAIAAALAVPEVHVTAVAGRNETLRSTIARRHQDDPRVSVLGFTDAIRQLLAAADVFVSATAGLSALEAQLCGCRMVWYGFAVGHVRDNVAALARHGLTQAAQTPAELTARLIQALTAGRPEILPCSDLPHGGDVLRELAALRRPGDGTTPCLRSAGMSTYQPARTRRSVIGHG